VPEWVSITSNLVLGVPLAALAVVFLRETARAAIAPLVGFRVFELQWGAGKQRFERAVGPIDLVLAPLPIAGATVARSGSPQRHRLGRIVLALTPIATQLLWLVARALGGTFPGGAPLFEGPAPLACLDLANTILLVAHATLALEISPGVRTDMRLLLDALLGHSDSDRAARANHYARLAKHHLERARVSAARDALDLARTQLGPQPLILACQDRLDATDLDSVVDQGDCIDDLKRRIEAAEPKRPDERAGWSLGERLRQGFFSALPLVAALLALTFAQADRLTRKVETGLSRLAEGVVESGEPTACDAVFERWNAWADRVDPWLPPAATVRSDRHLGFARLARCRGDADAAAAHHGQAMLAANAARTEDPAERFRNPGEWLSNELRLTSLLLHAAQTERDEKRFRDALRTLTKADRRLITLEGQLGFLGEADAKAKASSALQSEREVVAAIREEILAGMAAR